MVGTGRFELPTPRTPSECSTRLSHVPTEKYLLSVHDCGRCLERHPARPSSDQNGLMGRRDILFGQRRSFTKEVFLHLLHQKLLRFPGPGLQTVSVQQHFLPLDPLRPGFFGDMVVNFLAKFTIKWGLVEPFHFLLVARTNDHVWHSISPKLSLASL